MEGNTNTSSHRRTSSHLETPAQDCIVVQPLSNHIENHRNDADSDDAPMDLESSPPEAAAPTASECQNCKSLEAQLAQKDDMIKNAVEQVNTIRTQRAGQRGVARAEEDQLVHENMVLRQANEGLSVAAASLEEERLRLIAQLVEQRLRMSEIERERDEARKRAEDLEKSLLIFKQEITYVSNKVKDAVDRL